MIRSSILIFHLAFTLVVSASKAEMAVHADFEGGSVEVLEVDSERQYLKILPADYPGKGWRCWWYFRVDGLDPDKPLLLNVGEAPWATPERAHVSRDGGESWEHSSMPGIWDAAKKRIEYEIQTEGRQSLLLAWGPPFTPSDSHALVDQIARENEVATAFNLAETREGRETPALRITALGEFSNRKVVWLQARQHAWESGGSWVAKGIAEFLVSHAPEAVALRNAAVVYLVPVMDIDNTARGAGGKNQLPNDHNRDWSEKPHWKAVAAAQELIRESDKTGRLAVFVDLHNPGPGNLFPYYYIPEREAMDAVSLANLNRFLEISQTHMKGPLRFTGKAIETGKSYDPVNWKKISGNWVLENTRPGVVSATLETAWNTPASNTENYRRMGVQLGRAIYEYMATPIKVAE